MEEIIGVRQQPHLSPNYIPPTDITPDTYELAVNRDLLFEGLDLNAVNDGFSGLVGLSELVLIIQASFGRDPKKRRQAFRRLNRKRRTGVLLGPDIRFF
jgi:hypothetical protein